MALYKFRIIIIIIIITTGLNCTEHEPGAEVSVILLRVLKKCRWEAGLEALSVPVESLRLRPQYVYVYVYVLSPNGFVGYVFFVSGRGWRWNSTFLS